MNSTENAAPLGSPGDWVEATEPDGCDRCGGEVRACAHGRYLCRGCGKDHGPTMRPQCKGCRRSDCPGPENCGPLRVERWRQEQAAGEADRAGGAP